MRGIVTAVAAVLLLSACSSEDDSAEADPTPSPSETTASPTPSPSPTTAAPTTTAPPGVVFSLTGRALNNAKVVTVKSFWTGATASARKGSVVPEVRGVSTRAAQRNLAKEVILAARKGWVLPERPVGVVTRVNGRKRSGKVRVCLWSPSVSWVDKKTGKHVEAVRKRWLDYDFTVRAGRVHSYTWVGTCRRAAP